MATRNPYLEAVKSAGTVLRFVPAEEQMKNPEICLAAVRQNSAAVSFVADEVAGKFPQILEAAIDNPVYEPSMAMSM